MKKKIKKKSQEHPSLTSVSVEHWAAHITTSCDIQAKHLKPKLQGWGGKGKDLSDKNRTWPPTLAQERPGAVRQSLVPESIISISIMTGNLPVVFPQLISQSLCFSCRCPKAFEDKISVLRGATNFLLLKEYQLGWTTCRIFPLFLSFLMWWAVPGQQTATSSKRGRKYDGKAPRSGKSQGEHSSVTVTHKADLMWGKLCYGQLR